MRLDHLLSRELAKEKHLLFPSLSTSKVPYLFYSPRGGLRCPRHSGAVEDQFIPALAPGLFLAVPALCYKREVEGGAMSRWKPFLLGVLGGALVLGTATLFIPAAVHWGTAGAQGGDHHSHCLQDETMRKHHRDMHPGEDMDCPHHRMHPGGGGMMGRMM